MSEQSIKRRLVTGSIYAFGGQLVSTIAALAGTALLARILSPHNLGIYFIAFSVVSLLSVASQFGLGRTVVRTVAEADGASDGGRKREVIRKSLLILAVSTVVLAILMYSGGVDLLANSVFHVPAMTELSGAALHRWRVISGAA